MLRADALRAIYPELKDQIVVTIMGAVAAELYTLGHRPNFFYLEHAMGLASSMGLGIALAMPRRKVVVIDGDGSLLMLISYRGHMGERDPWQTQGGMVTEPLLRTLGIPIWHLSNAHDAQRRIKDAQILAHAALSPVAVLLSRELMWEE